MKKLYKLLLTFSLATGATHAATTQTIKYKVKSGDSLYKIAHKNNTTITKIRKANGIKKGEVLKLGKVIKVPKSVTSSKSKKKVVKKSSKKKSTTLTKYRIKKGDTLSSIARKHHTTIAKLRKVNGLKTSSIIKIGKSLKVPQNKKTIKFAKVKKNISNKKLAASLSRLDTISLEAGKAKAKKSNTFAFSDIFVGKNNKNADKCKKITSLAKKKLGKRYVWGASGNKNTYDCSSFVKYVYKKNGIELPRTSIMQSKVGKYVKRDELQKGDLIFFDTSKRRKGYVNHVGIYLGDNKFIHASSAKKKVVISKLHKNFYSNRYKGARRPS